MRPVLAFLVIGTVSSVGIQGAAPPQFNSRDTEQAVTIEGCLSGNRLKPEKGRVAKVTRDAAAYVVPYLRRGASDAALHLT